MRNDIHLIVTYEKMPTSSGCYIYIKNHDFCIKTIYIILILSFLLGINICNIYNEEFLKTNVHLKNADILNRAYPRGHRPPEAHAGGPSSQGGDGQPIMFEIKKRSTNTIGGFR